MSKLQLPINTFVAENLQVQIYQDRAGMGAAAAEDVITKINELLEVKPTIRMVFAAAPSQNELLNRLAEAQSIDWSRITVFHMDEYIGLPSNAPQAFGRFLLDRLFDRVQPGQVHLINSSGEIEKECAHYSELLSEAPIDIVCLGIGENGHLAFNDPPVADFADPLLVKQVTLDEACRRQQVNDGCFQTLSEVPMHALTLTIPTLLSAAHLFCVVPGATKRQAVYNTINAPITTACPASILRKHPHCTLYIDRDAYEGEL